MLFPGTLDEAFEQAVQFEALQETVDSSYGRDERRHHGKNSKDEGLARRVAQLEQKTVEGVEKGNQPNPEKMAELRRQVNDLS